MNKYKLSKQLVNIAKNLISEVKVSCPYCGEKLGRESNLIDKHCKSDSCIISCPACGKELLKIG